MRAEDRRKVQKERSAKHWLRLLWLLTGPGVLVMLGENDGPSMVSYATTGATYGVGFFVPFILLTFVMAFVVQEMTVRLGSATHRLRTFDGARCDRRPDASRLPSNRRQVTRARGLTPRAIPHSSVTHRYAWGGPGRHVSATVVHDNFATVGMARR